VERHEAEAIYAAGREAVVEVLLGMDRQIQTLTERVERLERELAKNSKNSSRPPSSDSSSVKKRGKPARPKLGDRPCAVVKWVDGTVLDTVWQVS